MAMGGCRCSRLVFPYSGCDFRGAAVLFGRCTFKSDRCVDAASCVGADCGVFRGSRVLLRHRVSFPPRMDESSDQLRGSWSASMNESTLTQLKVIVERAVRPVQASISCKRKMREEL